MRLFICTDPQDETALDPLLTVLGGYRLTIDVDRLIGGGDHRPRLQTAIQDCNAFIFALTPNTLRSSRCHWELAQATAFNRPILLVQLMPLVALPEGLRQLPHVDLDQDGGAEVLFALDALGATPPSFLAQLSQNRVRFGLVVILGIALALAGTNSPTRDLVHDTLLGVLAVADRTTGGDVAGTPIASPIPLFLLTPSPTAPPPTP
ncbi:MAG: toll/interleukin-1 receptor domain-containing protein, partial [Phototrophicaceae bacterium]